MKHVYRLLPVKKLAGECIRNVWNAIGPENSDLKVFGDKFSFKNWSMYAFVTSQFLLSSCVCFMEAFLYRLYL